MADKIDLRVVSFSGTGPGAGGGTLLAAVAGRSYKVWKVISAVGGAVIGNAIASPTKSFVVAAGVMPYDGAPYLVGDPGVALFWTDTAVAENLTVYYTQEGGV
jgi:hypothetical protein